MTFKIKQPKKLKNTKRLDEFYHIKERFQQAKS